MPGFFVDLPVRGEALRDTRCIERRAARPRAPASRGMPEGTGCRARLRYGGGKEGASMILRYLLSHGVPILLAAAALGLVLAWCFRGRNGRPPGDRY